MAMSDADAFPTNAYGVNSSGDFNKKKKPFRVFEDAGVKRDFGSTYGENLVQRTLDDANRVPTMLDSSLVPKKRRRKKNQLTPEQKSFNAAQRVMQSRTGLDRLEAMQDDDYQVGSGGALRETPRELGSERGRMRRAARALQRVGATDEANKMFFGAEMAGMAEPNIVTQEERERREMEKRDEINLMRDNEAKEGQARKIARRILDKRKNRRSRGGLRTGRLDSGSRSGGIAKYSGSVGL
tara:strand:- start:33683 stop:34402 length:720 start_codon:yes stop_codon:yes gene_type:complete